MLAYEMASLCVGGMALLAVLENVAFIVAVHSGKLVFDSVNTAHISQREIAVALWMADPMSTLPLPQFIITMCDGIVPTTHVFLSKFL